jgi:addiction module RelB/DinJ family antitoxin
MNTATISFRVAPETKRRARILFSRLGVTTSDAMNRLLADTLTRGTIPAPASGIAAGSNGDEIPNEETRRLLERLEAGTEPLYGPFDSVEEMFAALDAMPDE